MPGEKNGNEGFISASKQPENIKPTGRGAIQDEQDEFRRGQMMRINQGLVTVVNETIRDEFIAKLDARYKQGYRAGRDEERAKWQRKRSPSGPPLGRPLKYDFPSLRIGDTLQTSQKTCINLYQCARRWAQRNAPSRRYRVQPTPDGSQITRTR